MVKGFSQWTSSTNLRVRGLRRETMQALPLALQMVQSTSLTLQTKDWYKTSDSILLLSTLRLSIHISSNLSRFLPRPRYRTLDYRSRINYKILPLLLILFFALLTTNIDWRQLVILIATPTSSGYHIVKLLLNVSFKVICNRKPLAKHWQPLVGIKAAQVQSDGRTEKGWDTPSWRASLKVPLEGRPIQVHDASR